VRPRTHTAGVWGGAAVARFWIIPKKGGTITRSGSRKPARRQGEAPVRARLSLDRRAVPLGGRLGLRIENLGNRDLRYDYS
jgi:hypothetical protein